MLEHLETMQMQMQMKASPYMKCSQRSAFAHLIVDTFNAALVLEIFNFKRVANTCVKNVRFVSFI
jgi:hypothetical protein